MHQLRNAQRKLTYLIDGRTCSTEQMQTRGTREEMHLRHSFSTCKRRCTQVSDAAAQGGERPLRQSFSVDPASVLHERNTFLVAFTLHKYRHDSGEWTVRVPRSSLTACAFLLHACPPDMRFREPKAHDARPPQCHSCMC